MIAVTRVVRNPTHKKTAYRGEKIVLIFVTLDDDWNIESSYFQGLGPGAGLFPWED